MQNVIKNYSTWSKFKKPWEANESKENSPKHTQNKLYGKIRNEADQNLEAEEQNS